MINITRLYCGTLTPGDVLRYGRKSSDSPPELLRFSEDMSAKRVSFKDVLMSKLYKHYRVIRMSNKASRFLRTLFRIYCDNPEQLPPQAQENLEERGLYRVVCDYMAGMTDRYALDQYKRFFEPYERV